MTEVKCIQINLRLGKVALENLYQLIIDMDIDITFVQEPYVSKQPNVLSILIDASTQYDVFHNLSDDHAYGSFILAKRSFPVQQAKISCLNHWATAMIKLENGGQITLMSIYTRPSVTDVTLTRDLK